MLNLWLYYLNWNIMVSRKLNCVYYINNNKALREKQCVSQRILSREKDLLCLIPSTRTIICSTWKLTNRWKQGFSWLFLIPHNKEISYGKNITYINSRVSTTCDYVADMWAIFWWLVCLSQQICEHILILCQTIHQTFLFLDNYSKLYLTKCIPSYISGMHFFSIVDIYLLFVFERMILYIFYT